MIDNILGSKTNIRILRLLNKSPNRFFTIKEIQENTRLGFGNIFYSIKLLEYHHSIIFSENKIKSYKINTNNILNDKLSIIYHYENETFQNIDLETLKIVSEIEQEIIKNLNGVIKIILFGSIAKGAYNEKSDVDLAIIKKEKSSKDKLILSRIISKYNRTIQLHIFVHSEFEKSTEPLIKNIKKEGICLSDILTNK